MTAKCPYTKDQIIGDIEQWVSASLDGKEKKLDYNMCEKMLDSVFSQSYHGEPEGCLTFKEYCNNFTRWGTSGGALKINLYWTDYRSKWAWSIAHATDQNTGDLKHNYDLYAQAQKERTSTIALKEEPAKTREIITTSMASYLWNPIYDKAILCIAGANREYLALWPRVHGRVNSKGWSQDGMDQSTENDLTTAFRRSSSLE